jgi:hypothetical protein
MSNYRTNVTMIDDLPSLDDLEGNSGLSMIPSDNANQINKFIRNGYQPPQEAGMNTKQQQQQQQQQQHKQQQHQQHQQQHQQQQQLPVYEAQPQEIQFYEQPKFAKHIEHLSCISVAEHANNCIVCSRLYNNDRTGYVIVIILLAIICILLLKRVLNV